MFNRNKRSFIIRENETLSDTYGVLLNEEEIRIAKKFKKLSTGEIVSGINNGKIKNKDEAVKEVTRRLRKFGSNVSVSGERVYIH